MFAEQLNQADGAVIDSTDPFYLLEWSIQQFAGSIALATSLGNQTLVIIDMLHRLGKPVPVFCIDTGLLFDETYELWRKIEQRYGIQIESLRSPLSVADQSSIAGDALWKTQPDQCCRIRKVLPLRQRIQGLGAWITGLRRTPGSPTRGDVRGVEWDLVNGLFKVNPLWAWSRDDVAQYLAARNIPTHPLIEQGYRSIGCEPCTSPCDGGDERAGRWAGQGKTECGLHFATQPKNSD